MEDQEIENLKMKIDNLNNQLTDLQGKFTYHTHNGIDSSRINLGNTTPNNKFVTGFVSSDGGSTETFSAGIINPTSIQLFGIALDGLGARALITGNAQLGQGFITDGSNITYPSESGVIQACCSMYNSSTTTRVATASPYIGYVVDDTGTVKATITIDSFTNTSFTISAVLATNWTVSCNLIIT